MFNQLLTAALFQIFMSKHLSHISLALSINILFLFTYSRLVLTDALMTFISALSRLAFL